MRLLILIVFSLIGCVSLSLDEEAHRLALWNFSYQADVDDEWLIYDSLFKRPVAQDEYKGKFLYIMN